MPQYFVLVGGDVGEESARFGRLAAKIPARRIPDAVERLIEIYARDRDPGEPATTFFARTDLTLIRAELADLERVEPADLIEADFIDLGEAAEFAPEVMEGECAT